MFLDIIHKFDNDSLFKPNIVGKYIQKKKEREYRELIKLASEICSHSLLHRNHVNELVVCNTRFLIFTLFKRHKDLGIEKD